MSYYNLLGPKPAAPKPAAKPNKLLASRASAVTAYARPGTSPAQPAQPWWANINSLYGGQNPGDPKEKAVNSLLTDVQRRFRNNLKAGMLTGGRAGGGGMGGLGPVGPAALPQASYPQVRQQPPQSQSGQTYNMPTMDPSSAVPPGQGNPMYAAQLGVSAAGNAVATRSPIGTLAQMPSEAARNYGGMANMPRGYNMALAPRQEATAAPVTVAQDMQAQADSANAANEARYGQILGTNAAAAESQLGDLNTTYTGQSDILTGLQGGRRENQTTETGYLGGREAMQAGLLGQHNQTEMDREAKRRNDEMGYLTSSLYGRGLANTTVGDSLRRGIVDDSALREREIQNNLLDRQVNLGEQFTNYGYNTLTGANRDVEGLGLQGYSQAGEYGQQRQNVLGNAAQNQMGVMERRTDEGPDVNTYLQLLTNPQKAATTLPAGVKPYAYAPPTDPEEWKKLLALYGGQSA